MGWRCGAWVLLAAVLGSVPGSAVGAEAGTADSWLRLEQRAERLRLDTEQASHGRRPAPYSEPLAPVIADPDRQLERQRREQQLWFGRQQQEQSRFELDRGLNPGPAGIPEQRLWRQRVLQQNGQWRLQQDLQRRSRGAGSPP